MRDYEIGMVSVKLADTKLFVRMTTEGNPQLVRIEPLYNDNGVLIPISVMMYIDEEPGVLMDRVVAEMMADAYTPLEISRWKDECN
jgi:hypothetical protein